MITHVVIERYTDIPSSLFAKKQWLFVLGGYHNHMPQSLSCQNNNTATLNGKGAVVHNAQGKSPILLVCEHASNFISAQYDNLGLSREAQQAHIAWDIGAFSLACALSKCLDARLVASGISRLVYDCNRAFHQPSAIPKQSETYIIPGNQHLSFQSKRERFTHAYAPFADAMQKSLDSQITHVVSIHSFTPIFFGVQRAVHLGFIHDDEADWTNDIYTLAMTDLHNKKIPTSFNLMFPEKVWQVALNEPYSAKDKATHTIHRWGVATKRENTMIEVRNDLLGQPEIVSYLAEQLAKWLQVARSNSSTPLSHVAKNTPSQG